MVQRGGDVNLTVSLQAGHIGSMQMLSQKVHRRGNMRSRNDDRRDPII